MDELRVAQEAAEAQAVRPLGVSPHPRQVRQQVEMTGGESEFDGRPVGSERSLTTSMGLRGFVVGISDPFGNDVLNGPGS